MTATSHPEKRITKPRVLLVAEAVTLAHFGRIVTLAGSLDPDRYDISVASDPRYLGLEQPLLYDFHDIQSIPSAEFTLALAKGKAVYDLRTLDEYVEQDLQLLDRVQPDLVVGDFRLSLAVSAPLRAVRYASVVNAYWSPHADIAYPVPDLPFTRLLGLKLSQRLFNLVRPLAFAAHAQPLNRLRRRYGLAPVGNDLRQAYTWADYTLYADIAGAVPMADLPSSHMYLGPVPWVARAPLPGWWQELPGDKPVVFLTLGSSGDVERLPRLLEALAPLPLTFMVATAGRVQVPHPAPNQFITDYLPIDVAIQRADLVVSNGGSLTIYQALASGVPVLGLATNMDQLLSMQVVERLGAGVTLRSARAGTADVVRAVETLIGNRACAGAASRAAEALSHYDSAQRFRNFVDRLLQ